MDNRVEVRNGKQANERNTIKNTHEPLAIACIARTQLQLYIHIQSIRSRTNEFVTEKK